MKHLSLVLSTLLFLSCAHTSKVIKPEPCKVWVLPEKPVAGPTDIVGLSDGTTEYVALSEPIARWLDLYMSSVERQQELLHACPGVVFVTIGGADSLKKINLRSAGESLGKAANGR